MVFSYQKNADGHFVCGICGKTAARQNTMHYHLKTHEGKLPYECSICKKGFLHASTLDLHKKAQHEKEMDRMFKCPVLNCSFEGTLTKSNLLIHYVRKHCKGEALKCMERAEDGQIRCTTCNKETKSLTAFHYHVSSCIQLDDARAQQLADMKA